MLPTAPRMLLNRAPAVPRFVQRAVRWDGAYYLDIAGEGYALEDGARSSVAFFPLYPTLLAALSALGVPAAVGGVLLNAACCLAAFVLLNKLVMLEFGDRSAARRTLLYIAFFPTALFLVVLYSESLFLLLSVGGFYAARTRRWGWASTCGLLATATRPTGMILWGGLALEWLNQNGWTLKGVFQGKSWSCLGRALKKKTGEALSIALIPAGLVSYMFYLNSYYGDPRAFASVQVAWGRTPSLPLDEVYQGLRYIFFHSDPLFQPATPANSLCFILGLVGSIAVWRELGEAYGAFCLVSLLIPASSGLMSLPRFLLVVFPLFMVLARRTPGRRWEVALTGLFAIALFVFSSYFVNWYFIA